MRLGLAWGSALCELGSGGAKLCKHAYRHLETYAKHYLLPPFTHPELCAGVEAAVLPEVLRLGNMIGDDFARIAAQGTNAGSAAAGNTGPVPRSLGGSSGASSALAAVDGYRFIYFNASNQVSGCPLGLIFHLAWYI